MATVNGRNPTSTIAMKIIYLRLDASFYVVDLDTGDHFGPYATRSDARAAMADMIVEEAL